MVEAVVEYDYDAVHPDELTLKEGEIIANIDMLEEGWWEGELNGRRGMFPDNFVKVTKEAPKEVPKEAEKKSSKSKAPKPPVNGDTTSIHSSNSQGSQDSTEVVKREGASNKRKLRAKVAFSYHPENEDELSLEVDEIIEVTSQPEEGWWEGMLKGHRGVFPSNFVTLIEGDEDNMEVANGKDDKADGAVETKDDPPVKPVRPLSAVRLGSVKAPKRSGSKKASKENDVVKEEDTSTTPATPKPNKALGGKPPVGGVGFGNIFAGGSVHLRKTSIEPKGPKRAEPPKRPELSEAAQKRQSLRSKPPQIPDDVNKKEKEKKEIKPEIKPEKKDEEKEEKATEEVEIAGKNGPTPLKPSDEPPPTVVEKAKVVFDYDAANPDELSMKEGQVVVVLSKHAGDSGWWEGELHGKKGVFPDNFVELLPPEKIKKRLPAPVPNRPTAAPKDDLKPQFPSKPKKASKELPAKPILTDSDPPKEPVTKEEPKIHIPAGAKQILPMVPPKKHNLRKPPPKPQPSTDKETREVPRRPPSFVDKERASAEKRDPPVDTTKKEKDEATFDDIKPKSEKLTHLNLNRPRHAHKRPPSVFGAMPGLTVNDGISDEDALEQLTPPRRNRKSKQLRNIQQDNKPIENDISGPPARPKSIPAQAPSTTPPTAPTPATKPDTSPLASPSNSRPSSMAVPTSEPSTAAAATTTSTSAEVLSAMEDMKKSMQDQMTSMRADFKKEIKKLMVEVDEEKILRLSMQVELERIKKLVLDS